MGDSDCRVKQVLLGLCLFVVGLAISVPILIHYSSLLHPYPNEGLIIAENCYMDCSDSEWCIYEGTVTISFIYDNQTHEETVPVNGDCKPDCCASALRKKETVSIELNSNLQIINFAIPKLGDAIWISIFAISFLIIAFVVLVIAGISVGQWWMKMKGRRAYHTLN
jgi:hypothetical protein